MSCAQGINDFDLAAFTDGGVNITGLRLVDVLNKTVRDFILDRQKHRTSNASNNSRRISVNRAALLPPLYPFPRSLAPRREDLSFIRVLFLTIRHLILSPRSGAAAKVYQCWRFTLNLKK